MNRREAISLGGFLACGAISITACGGVPVDLKITIPDELKDAIAAITKLDSLRNLLPGSVGDLIDRGKQLVATITGAVSLDTLKSAGGSLVALLGTLTEYLPKTGTVGNIVTAIETLLPLMAQSVGLGARMAARRSTGMSVAQARAILR